MQAVNAYAGSAGQNNAKIRLSFPQQEAILVLLLSKTECSLANWTEQAMFGALPSGGLSSSGVGSLQGECVGCILNNAD